MSFTNDDLHSAIDKLGSIDLTDAEIEALTSILAAGDDEVSGYRLGSGGKGWDLMGSFKASGWKVEETTSARWKVEETTSARWKVEEGTV
jgi:hypothetical protein